MLKGFLLGLLSRNLKGYRPSGETEVEGSLRQELAFMLTGTPDLEVTYTLNWEQSPVINNRASVISSFVQWRIGT